MVADIPCPLFPEVVGVLRTPIHQLSPAQFDHQPSPAQFDHLGRLGARVDRPAPGVGPVDEYLSAVLRRGGGQLLDRGGHAITDVTRMREVLAEALADAPADRYARWLRDVNGWEVTTIDAARMLRDGVASAAVAWVLPHLVRNEFNIYTLTFDHYGEVQDPDSTGVQPSAQHLMISLGGGVPMFLSPAIPPGYLLRVRRSEANESAAAYRVLPEGLIPQPLPDLPAISADTQTDATTADGDTGTPVDRESGLSEESRAQLRRVAAAASVVYRLVHRVHVAEARGDVDLADTAGSDEIAVTLPEAEDPSRISLLRLIGSVARDWSLRQGEQSAAQDDLAVPLRRAQDFVRQYWNQITALAAEFARTPQLSGDEAAVITGLTNTRDSVAVTLEIQSITFSADVDSAVAWRLWTDLLRVGHTSDVDALPTARGLSVSEVEGYLRALRAVGLVTVTGDSPYQRVGAAIPDRMIADDRELVRDWATTLARTERDIVDSVLDQAPAFSCTVCLTDIDQSEELVTMSCYHTYHLDCLSRWMRNALTCPLCRTEMTQTYVSTLLRPDGFYGAWTPARVAVDRKSVV